MATECEKVREEKLKKPHFGYVDEKTVCRERISELQLQWATVGVHLKQEKVKIKVRKIF